MRFKNFVRLALAIISAATLSACANSDSSDKTKNENLPEIVIASDIYDPYTFFDENGDFTGIDVEIAEETFKRLGYKPIFIKVDWEDKDKLLADGEVDCIWSCFSMDGREDKYSWAGLYIYSAHSVAVRASGDIQSLSDLNGKKIAVQASTKSEELLLARPYDNIPDADKIYSFVDLGEIFGALSKGYVDACAGHEEALQNFIKDSPESYRILDEPLAKSKLGVAFRKDDGKELAKEVSNVLSEMNSEGFIAQIAEKYGVSVKKYGMNAENVPEVDADGEK